MKKISVATLKPNNESKPYKKSETLFCIWESWQKKLLNKQIRMQIQKKPTNPQYNIKRQ